MHCKNVFTLTKSCRVTFILLTLFVYQKSEMWLKLHVECHLYSAIISFCIIFYLERSFVDLTIFIGQLNNLHTWIQTEQKWQWNWNESSRLIKSLSYLVILLEIMCDWIRIMCCKKLLTNSSMFLFILLQSQWLNR